MAFTGGVINPEDYINPQCEILIDGKSLKITECSVEQVMVKLSLVDKLNSCMITLSAAADYKNGEIAGGILDKLRIGTKAVVKMGYSKTTEVFMGYVNTVDVMLTGEGVIINVSCLDARGLLVGNTKWKSYDKQKLKAILEGLFEPLRPYLKQTTVKIKEEQNKEVPPPTRTEIDDYSYVQYLASITDSSFYMPGAELKFVSNVYEEGKIVADYTWGESLISFRRTADLSEQVESVTVEGSSPDDEETFKSTVKATQKGGKVEKPVKGKEQTVSSQTVKNAKEAKKYAEAIMTARLMKVCFGHADVLGNEGLETGQMVSFSKLDPYLDGVYTIMDLVHTYSTRGFITTIGFARPKI